MSATEKQKKREELTKTVKDYVLNDLGAALVGVANANDPQFARAPKGHHPTEILPGAKSVVVLAIRQLDEALDDSSPGEIHYKHYDLMNAWLEKTAFDLAFKMKNLGYKGLFIPESDPYAKLFGQRNVGLPRFSPIFCHIHAAVAAGLGKRGKIGIVLTPQFGPYQRWISVITTADLVPDPRLKKEVCLDFIKEGSCGSKCLTACPNGSLRAWPDEGGAQMFKCLAEPMRQQGLLCQACLCACPVGK
jgi:epoxyqueuosine reductase